MFDNEVREYEAHRIPPEFGALSLSVHGFPVRSMALAPQSVTSSASQ